MGQRLLFGEFLVQKNLIKANTILGLLVEQLKSQPSIGEIVFQNGLLTDQQQLEVFRLQSINGWDYQQSCVELGLWTADLAKKVLNETVKSRLPIGQLIVAKGIMSFGELTKALDEFVGMCESDGSAGNSPRKQPPPVPKVTLDEEQGAKPVITQVDSPLVEGGAPSAVSDGSSSRSETFQNLDAPKIEQVILTEFFEVMTLTRSEELIGILKGWPSKIGDLDMLNMEIRAILGEMESLNAAAKFIQVAGIVLVSHGMVNILSALRSNPLDAVAIDKVSGALIKGVMIMWKLRAVLAVDRSEAKYLRSDAGHRELGEFVAACEGSVTV